MAKKSLCSLRGGSIGVAAGAAMTVPDENEPMLAIVLYVIAIIILGWVIFVTWRILQ